MMLYLPKAFFALSVLAMPISVLASGADIRVIGTISPTACIPTLSDGGTLDYGTIRANMLSDADYTLLPEKSLAISISCDAPSKIALMGRSGRPGTAAGTIEFTYGQGPGPVAIEGDSQPPVVGLGLDGTARIGGYTLRIMNPVVDGIPRVGMGKTLGATSWVNGPAYDSLFNRYYSNLHSFGVSPATGPIAFELLVAQMWVRAYINKGSELDLSKPIYLDGLTIIDMIYL